jgi:hypothetical protein
MRHRAALFGAALAAGGFALIAGRSPAGTIGILSLADPGCCSVSDGSKLQIDPDGAAKGEAFAVPQRSNGEPIPSLDDGRSEPRDPVTVTAISNDGSESAGDSLGPDAVSLEESGGSDDNAPDGASSVAAAEPSVLSRVLMIFADLRATVVRGP